MNFVPPALSCSSLPPALPPFPSFSCNPLVPLPCRSLAPSYCCVGWTELSVEIVFQRDASTIRRNRRRVRRYFLYARSRRSREQTKQPCLRNQGVRNNFLLRHGREKLLPVIAADSRGNGRYSARKCMYIPRVRKFVASPRSERARERARERERERHV